MASSFLKAVITAASGTLFLAACGGGGSSGSASPTPSQKTQEPPTVALPTTVISGVFDGKSNTNQPLTAFLQNDGSYFLVYSDATSPQRFTNAVMGSGTLSNGSFSSGSGIDVPLAGSGTQSPLQLTLSASYQDRQSFNGSVSYTASGKSATFATNFNNAYETLPSLSALAGVYVGTITTKDLVEAGISLTIASDGRLSGALPCGCSIEAKLVARSDGKAYDATLAFVGGTHPFSGNSFAGNVYLDAATHRLYIVGKVSSTGEHAIFVGSKS